MRSWIDKYSRSTSQTRNTAKRNTKFPTTPLKSIQIHPTSSLSQYFLNLAPQREKLTQTKNAKQSLNSPDLQISNSPSLIFLQHSFHPALSNLNPKSKHQTRHLQPPKIENTNKLTPSPPSPERNTSELPSARLSGPLTPHHVTPSSPNHIDPQDFFRRVHLLY